VGKVIHIVIGGGVVFNAYTRADLAYRHAMCVKGCDVVACQLLDELPPEIRTDLQVEWEGDDDTPVETEPVKKT
jgi:hypothetical protein